MQINQLEPKNRIILYDGVCALCHWSIKYVLHYDKDKKFFFIPLQSQSSQILSGKTYTNESVIYYDGITVYRKSSAVIKILKDLGGFSSIMGTVFSVFPPSVRDFFYDTIASIRYKIFGKVKTCSLPDNELKSRHIEVI